MTILKWVTSYYEVKTSSRRFEVNFDQGCQSHGPRAKWNPRDGHKCPNDRHEENWTFINNFCFIMVIDIYIGRHDKVDLL